MVSSTLCPAVHILGSQNVYGRAEGIADHYWPCAVFYIIIFPRMMKFSPFTLISDLQIRLVLTGAYYHVSEHYHDFSVEIMHSENR